MAVCAIFKLGPFWIDLNNIQDVYLQECLNRVGIWKADLKHLLAEDATRGGRTGCSGGFTMASRKVMFHFEDVGVGVCV